jgi:hypothetical protein
MRHSKAMLAVAALLVAACLVPVSAGSDVDCTPGHDETCSEENLHGAGTCRPDGTCACSEGYLPDARGKCVPYDAGMSAAGGGSEMNNHKDGGFHWPWPIGDGGVQMTRLCSDGCAPNQICVHPSCGSIFPPDCQPLGDGGVCPNGPCSLPIPMLPCACTPAEPYCMDVPTSCDDGGLSCGCFLYDPCATDNGKCSSITDAGLKCVPD